VYSNWPAAAREEIARATAHLAPDASLQERKTALRGVGPDFHGYTSHGKKVWSRECRKYYERHGQPPRTPDQAQGKIGDKIRDAVKTGEICFSFKAEDHGS